MFRHISKQLSCCFYDKNFEEGGKIQNGKKFRF